MASCVASATSVERFVQSSHASALAHLRAHARFKLADIELRFRIHGAPQADGLVSIYLRDGSKGLFYSQVEHASTLVDRLLIDGFRLRKGQNFELLLRR